MMKTQAAIDFSRTRAPSKSSDTSSLELDQIDRGVYQTFEHLSVVPDQSRVYSGLLQTVSNVFLTGAPTEALHVRTSDAWGRARSFECGLFRGRPGRPLVFLIPGFGCPWDEKTALYLSRVLSDRGFHVATLHSPSHPKFLLNSHHSGIPGVTSEDSADALLGILAIQRELRDRGLKFKETHLVGYSMGALNAAFVQYLDRGVNDTFAKVVLINPPISMAYGMKQLDSFLAAQKMTYAAKAVLISKVVPFIFAFQRLKMPKKLQMKLFLANTTWTETELRALIGYSFEKTVAGGIEAASRLGLLPESHAVESFTDFCETATVSHYQNFYPGATSTDLFFSESLLRIGSVLAEDGRVSVLHNENDFLVRDAELTWLKQKFGHQAHVFKTGGHLGNIWREDFQTQLELALGHQR